MGSKRLPGKVLLKINKKTIIEIILDRLSKSKLINKIVFATSTNKNNKVLIKYFKNKKINFFPGSETDVLSRYINIIDKEKPKVVVRITADCPLIDPVIVDKCIKIFLNKNLDYVSNVNPPTFPDGFDVEVINPKALVYSFKFDKSKNNKEHVTQFIKHSNKFSKFNLRLNKDYSNLRVTIDYNNDLLNVKKIFDYFDNNIFIDHKSIIKFLLLDKKTINHPKILKSNNLWKKANKIIPKGNMLLSKNPETILPNIWPAYYNKAKGCYIWDIDHNKFIDFSYMGVGTNILGYSNKEVDNSVKKAINDGNISSLNCYEEVHLAEKLLKMHKWANKVRFARTGGEANAIAIRIARAASKKDNIAICGYHGWHDWYLSANLQDSKSLDSLLLKGLNINGVPKNLKDTVFPFRYNDLKGLKNLIKQKKIGIVKMEVMRNDPPLNNFLHEIRKVCDENKIILIFDECTSAFRETFGGLHLKYKVYPDLAVFGKALGNGYPITAVIGKDIYMNAVQDSFISSTFWTERLGSVAALKTLEIMKREKSWKIISNKGKKLKTKILQLAKINKIDIYFTGLSSLFTFNIISRHKRNYNKIISSEMIKQNILATNSIYCSVAHNDEITKKYLFHLNNVFKLINFLENKHQLPKEFIFQNTLDKFDRLN